MHHENTAKENSGGGETPEEHSDIRALYEKYSPMVFRRCNFLLRDEEKALDALQDVFVRIMERKNKRQPLCCSFLYRVATTVCLNKIRSEKLRRHLPIDERVLLIAEKGKSHDETTLVEMALEQIFFGMKENTQYIAVLHYVDGLTLEETANEVHMSVSGVRKRLVTLREKMKREGHKE